MCWIINKCMINNKCCVNSRLLQVRFRTMATRSVTVHIRYIQLWHPIPYHIVSYTTWKQLEIIRTLPLVCPQITVNDLQNLFDKIIVFQIDLSSIYHSFYIFITIICRGYIYIFHNIVFLLFALTSSTRQIFPFFNHSLLQLSLFPHSHSLNPSKSPLFLHFHYFSLISSKNIAS